MNDDARRWDDVRQCLDQLEALLLTVPEESPHASQAHNILNKVRACKAEWKALTEERKPGRPQGRFLVKSGCEEAFRSGLVRLLTERFDPETSTVKVNDEVVLGCPSFFAYCYDLCVQTGLTSGSSDLKAFYLMLCQLVQQVTGSELKMAYKTLTLRVNKWANYMTEGCEGRLLHQISQEKVGLRELKRQVSSEKSISQCVATLLRQYGIIPEAQGPR